jgi:hypothetical protein
MTRGCRPAALALAIVGAAAFPEGLYRPINGGAYLPEHARGGKLAATHPELLPPTDYGKPPSRPEKMYLEVPLDHFDPANKKTWKDKFYINRGNWDPENGPIFVEMGGEGACGGVGVSADAIKHQAMMVAVEHRFYGESVPFGDMSTANLKYLTVEQNLADTAAIVEHVQATFGQGTRRVVLNFGGSYSGATSAWFREKYPNVTHAAFSSSGVVNAILDMTTFDEQVAKAIAVPDPECPQRLIASTKAMETLFAQGSGDKIKQMYNAENLIGTKYGDTDFWYAAADGVAMTDQYGSKKELCEHLALLPESPSNWDYVHNIVNFTLGHYGPDFAKNCFYDSECIKNATLKDPKNPGTARNWRYQKCREVAFLQPAPKTGSLRSRHLTLDILIEQCKYAFDGLDPSNAAAGMGPTPFNAKFGGATMTPTDGSARPSRIFFTDYSDDPWARASVQSSPGPEMPYCLTTCNGCGHCGAGVPHNLTKCRDEQTSYVSKWLAAARRELAAVAEAEAEGVLRAPAAAAASRGGGGASCVQLLAEAKEAMEVDADALTLAEARFNVTVSGQELKCARSLLAQQQAEAAYTGGLQLRREAMAAYDRAVSTLQGRVEALSSVVHACMLPQPPPDCPTGEILMRS